MAKLKKCSFCGQETSKLWYAKPPCCTNWSCKQKYNEQRDIRKNEFEGSNRNLSSNTTSRKNTIKKKNRKPTGELRLFLRIYAGRGGRCEITNTQIPFNVWSFAHILSKGAYPGYRLNPENIIMVLPRIHELYDTSSREKLLQEFPEAIKIYEMKDKLKYEYYNGRKTEFKSQDKEDPAED